MTDRSDANYRREAIALAYEAGEYAPKLLAKGYGQTAERIIEQAKRNGIYVHDSPELVGLLMQLDVDQYIPAELYQVIAELIIWLQELDDKN